MCKKTVVLALVLLLLASFCNAEEQESPEKEPWQIYEEGTQLFRLGRHDEALERFQSLAGTHLEFASDFRISECYIAMGRRDMAIEHYQLMKEKYPKHADQIDRQITIATGLVRARSLLNDMEDDLLVDLSGTPAEPEHDTDVGMPKRPPTQGTGLDDNAETNASPTVSQGEHAGETNDRIERTMPGGTLSGEDATSQKQKDIWPFAVWGGAALVLAAMVVVLGRSCGRCREGRRGPDADRER